MKKAVQTAEKGNKEDIIKNETLKNIEVKLDIRGYCCPKIS